MSRARRFLYEATLKVAELLIFAVAIVPTVFVVHSEAPTWIKAGCLGLMLAWMWFWYARAQKTRKRFFVDSFDLDEVAQHAPPVRDHPPSPRARPDAKMRYLRRLRAIADRRPFDGA
jgi:hypothetical protein